MKYLWMVNGIFVLGTTWHVICAMLTAGDYGPLPGDIGIYSMGFILAAVSGTLLGSMAPMSGALRTVLMLFLLFGVLFWMLVPDRWWAIGPGRNHDPTTMR